MKKKDKAGLTENHYVDFAQATGAQTTLTAYGKIIRNSEALPSDAGIVHPYGLKEPLQASLVFGIAIGGRCKPLPNPERVLLPPPDGPADGCGWNPAEYVVWKNLPVGWTTIHFQARATSLHDALLPGSSKIMDPLTKTATVAVMGVRDRVVEIVKLWAKMSSDPRGSDQLQVLWANSKPPSSFGDGAKILAQDINSAFSTHFRGSDFDPPDKIKTVEDLVDAIT
jgi:hypothetical protein